MILFIAGTTHTGKTALAQRLLEKYAYPYFSIDHLKMGLVRSGNTELTPCSEDLTEYLWPIVAEMAKTAIENRQNLIIEGCYVPFDWRRSFAEEYLREIRAVWLIMSDDYINTHYNDIGKYANTVESRMENEPPSAESLIEDNRQNLAGCREHGCEYILIDKEYSVDITL